MNEKAKRGKKIRRSISGQAIQLDNLIGKVSFSSQEPVYTLMLVVANLANTK